MYTPALVMYDTLQAAIGWWAGCNHECVLKNRDGSPRHLLLACGIAVLVSECCSQHVQPRAAATPSDALDGCLPYMLFSLCKTTGSLTTKVGTLGRCTFDHQNRAAAVEL